MDQLYRNLEGLLYLTLADLLSRDLGVLLSLFLEAYLYQVALVALLESATSQLLEMTIFQVSLAYHQLVGASAGVCSLMEDGLVLLQVQVLPLIIPLLGAQQQVQKVLLVLQELDQVFVLLPLALSPLMLEVVVLRQEALVFLGQGALVHLSHVQVEELLFPYLHQVALLLAVHLCLLQQAYLFPLAQKQVQPLHSKIHLYTTC